MMTRTSQAKRFRGRRDKLVAFLRGGEVVEAHFDISMFGWGRVTDLPAIFEKGKTGCGTTACVAGLCPVVFPDDWKWSCGHPYLTSDPSQTAVNSFAEFFGLSRTRARVVCLYQPSNTTAAEAADILESFNA